MLIYCQLLWRLLLSGFVIGHGLLKVVSTQVAGFLRREVKLAEVVCAVRLVVNYTFVRRGLNWDVGLLLVEVAGIGRVLDHWDVRRWQLACHHLVPVDSREKRVHHYLIRVLESLAWLLDQQFE